MDDAPRRAVVPARLLAGLLVVALVTAGCSTSPARTGPLSENKATARPSLKERRAKYIEKLQGTP